MIPATSLCSPLLNSRINSFVTARCVMVTFPSSTAYLAVISIMIIMYFVLNVAPVTGFEPAIKCCYLLKLTESNHRPSLLFPVKVTVNLYPCTLEV